jgi:hypothetical protein
MKPWRTPFIKAPSKGRKKETKREDSSLSPKNKKRSSKWVALGTKTSHVPEPPLSQEAYLKERRMGNLKEQ